MSLRKATHAGMWYNDSETNLSTQLQYWLDQVNLTHSPTRAIIAPHAGYKYCGACAGYAYKQIDPTVVQKIFILGPSHKICLSGCFVMDAQKYETPLYDLSVDTQTVSNLQSTGHFKRANLYVDENEHSIEMQLPYIAKIMENYKDRFTIIPILVGTLTSDEEVNYGRVFSTYLADPKNLFIISSDFCHWGEVFKYTYYDPSQGEIYQSIENLDRMGMIIIENLNPTEFTNYLETYKNNICGRHAIQILLQAIQDLLGNGIISEATLRFLNYRQSDQCRNKRDTSVSYASAALVIN